MWVILQHFEHNPVKVYGTFNSEAEAVRYAENLPRPEYGTYSINQILDIKDRVWFEMRNK